MKNLLFPAVLLVAALSATAAQRTVAINIFEKSATNEYDRVKLLRDAGFGGFFSVWDRGRSNTRKLREAADALGMEYVSIHAPWTRLRPIWFGDDAAARRALDEQIACLRACAEAKVPVMVAHAIIGFNAIEPTELGIERFGELVAEAEKLGVRIAFENTEGEAFLAALLARYDSPAIGFCWDTGHQLCYNPTSDLMTLYGDRLLALHLNDNLGVRSKSGKISFTDDIHLFPFEGTNDWTRIAERLRSFNGPLTFEINVPGVRNPPKDVPFDWADFLRKARAAAARFEAL